jgi:hypothetical protein
VWARYRGDGRESAPEEARNSAVRSSLGIDKQEIIRAMTGFSPAINHQVHLLDRRRLLRLLAIVPLALSVTLPSGCAGSIPPRQYKRSKSHIVGGNSRGGR